MPHAPDAADCTLEVAAEGEDGLLDCEEGQQMQRRVVYHRLQGQGPGVAAGLGEAAEDEARVAAVVVVVVVAVFVLAAGLVVVAARGARPPAPPRRDDGGGGLCLKPPEAEGLCDAREGAQDAERGADERAAEGFSCEERRAKRESKGKKVEVVEVAKNY